MPDAASRPHRRWQKERSYTAISINAAFTTSRAAQCADGMVLTMTTLHCTKTLLDRMSVSPSDSAVPPDAGLPPDSLGNWYATVLRWRPQVALLVNERTLLPVLMPLAPAKTLLQRVPRAVAEVLAAHGIADAFQRLVVAEMQSCSPAKTASRQMVGMLNEFGFLADSYRQQFGADLLGISLRLAQTPCSPLKGRAPVDALGHVTCD